MKKIFGSLVVALSFLFVTSAAACNGWCGDEDWDFATNGGNNDLSQNQGVNNGANWLGGFQLTNGNQVFHMDGYAYGDADYSSAAGQKFEGSISQYIPGGEIWAGHIAVQDGVVDVAWCGVVDINADTNMNQGVFAGVNFNQNGVSMGSATGGHLDMNASIESQGFAIGTFNGTATQGTGHNQTIYFENGFGHTESYSVQSGTINVSVGETD